jgi:hypothetical protein
MPRTLGCKIMCSTSSCHVLEQIGGSAIDEGADWSRAGRCAGAAPIPVAPAPLPIRAPFYTCIHSLSRFLFPQPSLRQRRTVCIPSKEARLYLAILCPSSGPRLR